MLTHWLPMTSIRAAICRIFSNNFKRLYAKNGRLFLDFLLNFWNVHKIWNIWKKRMSVLAWLFPKVLLPKEVATETSTKSCFRTPFGNQRVNGFQTPLKVARHHYYPLFPWIPGEWVRKRLLYSDQKSSDCLLTHWLPVTSIPAAICRIFCNNFKRYYLKKRKTFSGFFIAFLKCAWSLEHFEEKDECPSLIISGIIVSERGCYWNV